MAGNCESSVFVEQCCLQYRRLSEKKTRFQKLEFRDALIHQVENNPNVSICVYILYIVQCEKIVYFNNAPSGLLPDTLSTYKGLHYSMDGRGMSLNILWEYHVFSGAGV